MDSLQLSLRTVTHFNELVMRGLNVPDGGAAGRIRTRSVVVGNVYRGAPAEDCEYLLDQLCSWLAKIRMDVSDDLRQPLGIISAIVAHLYLAWIHPFDDGNGRTARLIEYQLLIEAGVPSPAAHLLSNYYNRTRSRYYKVLAETSRPPYPVENFISYAVTGFCEELRSQLDYMRTAQMHVAWVNYVHEKFRGRGTQSAERQRELVLALPGTSAVPVSEVRRLTPALAEKYAGKQQKTITRDLNRLELLGLIRRSARGGVRARHERMAAFLPLRAETDDPQDF
ncbi:MAG: Fic family protein [Angustibacter sp.]